MSSQRPRRAASQPTLPANIRRGLESICVGNETLITTMLGAEANGRGDGTLVDKLAQVMAVNTLSAEQMLARFFDAGTLGAYCAHLGKSDKGAVATLAARIAREWSHPDFGRGPEDEMEAAPRPGPVVSYKQPTWMELQTDSDDEEDVAQRKKQLKAQMRRAKAEAKSSEVESSEVVSSRAEAEANVGVGDAPEAPKRRKLDADETARALSRAAYHEEVCLWRR